MVKNVFSCIRYCVHIYNSFVIVHFVEVTILKFSNNEINKVLVKKSLKNHEKRKNPRKTQQMNHGT